jgi:hypothetical protein
MLSVNNIKCPLWFVGTGRKLSVCFQETATRLRCTNVIFSRTLSVEFGRHWSEFVRPPVSVLVEAPIEISFVMCILLSSPSAAALNGLCADGSLAVLGIFTALSFDTLPERPPRTAIKSDWRGPKTIALTDDNLSPPGREGLMQTARGAATWVRRPFWLLAAGAAFAERTGQ